MNMQYTYLFEYQFSFLLGISEVSIIFISILHGNSGTEKYTPKGWR